MKMYFAYTLGDRFCGRYFFQTRNGTFLITMYAVLNKQLDDDGPCMDHLML